MYLLGSIFNHTVYYDARQFFPQKLKTGMFKYLLAFVLSNKLYCYGVNKYLLI